MIPSKTASIAIFIGITILGFISTQIATAVDTDEDGIDDANDNCPLIYNPSQDVSENGSCATVSDRTDAGTTGLQTSQSSLTPPGWVQLYDLTFSTPPHTVGQPPLVGPDVPIPLEVLFGLTGNQVLVVQSHGELRNQPALIVPQPPACGVRQFFRLHGGYFFPPSKVVIFEAYHIELELLIETMGENGFLGIFTDLPRAHHIEFLPNRTIRAHELDGQPSGVLTDIGSFEFGTPFFLEIEIDIIGKRWSIWKDGSELFNDVVESFANNSGSNSMRIILINGSCEDPLVGDAIVALDNVKVFGITDRFAPSCSASAASRADTDDDADVDGIDFTTFASCFNRAGRPPRTLGCAHQHAVDLDFDDDHDVDGVDFTIFTACFNRAGNRPWITHFPLQ